MSQENSDKSVPTISPETGDVDPPTVSSAEPANSSYEYDEGTGPAAEADIIYYDEENISEEQTKQSSSDHPQPPPLPPTPPKRESGSIAAAPMEMTTTAQHTGWFLYHFMYSAHILIHNESDCALSLCSCCNRMFDEKERNRHRITQSLRFMI